MIFLSVTMGVPFHEVRQWSAAEISLYQVYYRMDPWGEERADLRNGMLLQQTANMHRDTKANPKPFEIYDFMPYSKKPKKVKKEKPGSEPAGLRQMFKSLAKK
jgi:hypothetical protein